VPPRQTGWLVTSAGMRRPLSTAAKHGLGVFAALVMLTKGQPLDTHHRLIKPERFQLP
jgi:hypothetical protein